MGGHLDQHGNKSQTQQYKITVSRVYKSGSLSACSLVINISDTVCNILHVLPWRGFKNCLENNLQPMAFSVTAQLGTKPDILVYSFHISITTCIL